ncbi:hypothetical protein D3C87_29160 [compost metagenome]
MNTSIFNTINSLGETISSTKSYMVVLEDKYRYPPYLRFKFVNASKKNLISDYIINRVSEFSGNLKWKIYTKSDSNNFILAPAIFEEYIGSFNTFNEKHLFSVFGENYYNIVDDAISDIEKLSDFLKSGDVPVVVSSKS